ncbi:hypothetical protein FHS21_001350 [Phyllobacterium trifolii]|uniref:Tail fiber protein n=1 Tax=Phyllobacterium trifolii TaxID=300193 RepID=A0A839U9M1_9HYPH|nr:hypothetical protein [Phyllobacterium trifolii]MBB3144949.1 hypothetical protein [Phyllobacterium trifolii]
MAENPDITDGTVSVTTGTKAVTGVGTLWSTYGILPGDTFGSDGYARARIESVNSDTSITLRDNWRGPTLAAGSSYWIRYQADASRYSALLGAVRKILTQPILTAFSGLTAAADKLPYFTGANTMALVDFKVWARSFLGLTMAADKLPYGTGANTMDLVDFKAWARSMLGLTPAANKGIFFTSGTAAALFDLTAAGRAIAGGADAAAQLTALGFSPFVQSLIDDVNATTLRGSIGLGNVDNTSDANKPVSTAQSTAIAAKVDRAGDTMNGVLGLQGAGSQVYQLQAINAATLANGAGLTWNNGSGVIIVNVANNGMVAIFTVGGGVVTLGTTTGGFTTAGNNPGTVNVFYEPGLTRYQVQNLLGGSISISVVFIRTRGSV